ncbi:signal recognition particle-docking protein FtsY [Treponema bryantii]|uniref:signal recognition particle-docking protein FtsY n=1 Tax=Treponema bryantii TaxID=163 RepID=UPI002B2D9326|nr:signal recognition particle-docking protein FtsY [Treponema bryantii]
MKQSFGEKLKSLFSKSSTINEDFFEELTDMLVEGDIGAKTAFEVVDELESICDKEKIREQDAILAKLKELLLKDVRSVSLIPEAGKQNVWMMLGVNGVGKTTTAAKLAKYFKNNGVENIVMASADTFRAAAIEQLALHGERLGVRVVSHQHGSDPSAVVYDAADALRAAGPGLVIADTAGRLHNKENLVRELQKIDRTCGLKADEGCYKKILVIDSTTGQNALRQAEVFNEAVKIDAIIMTKYDSTAKGGVAVSIGRELGLPVAYICTGEGYDNIAPFNAEAYINEFLSMQG